MCIMSIFINHIAVINIKVYGFIIEVHNYSYWVCDAEKCNQISFSTFNYIPVKCNCTLP